MLDFLCKYMTEHMTITPDKTHNGQEVTITENARDGGSTTTESIRVYKAEYGDEEGSVMLEVAFDKKKMEQLDHGYPKLRSTRWEQNVSFSLGSGYGEIPVYKLTRDDGSGFLLFNVTDYSEDKACKLFDVMLYRFSHVIRK